MFAWYSNIVFRHLSILNARLNHLSCVCMWGCHRKIAIAWLHRLKSMVIERCSVYIYVCVSVCFRVIRKKISFDHRCLMPSLLKKHQINIRIVNSKCKDNFRKLRRKRFSMLLQRRKIVALDGDRLQKTVISIFPHLIRSNLLKMHFKFSSIFSPVQFDGIALILNAHFKTRELYFFFILFSSAM